MTAEEFLKRKGIEDRVINREDLTEFWLMISQLMQQYHQSELSRVRKIDVEHIYPSCPDGVLTDEIKALREGFKKALEFLTPNE
jgi:hypothetical protein